MEITTKHKIMSKLNTETQLPQTIVSDSYSWLKKGITAYTFGAILTPVEIEILEVDFENKIATVKTEFQQGKLYFDRIYKTASECDFL